MLFFPSLIFTLGWVITFVLFAFRLTGMLLPLTLEYFILFGAIGCIGLLSFMIYFSHFRRPRLQPRPFDAREGLPTTRYLCLLWLLLVFYHLQKFGGRTPILGTIPYTEFLQQPYTGLMNSLSLLIFALSIHKFFSRIFFRSLCSKIFDIFSCACVVGWSVVQMNRQIAIGCAIIGVICFLKSLKSDLSRFVVLSVSAVTILAGFGMLGERRSGSIIWLAEAQHWPDVIPQVLIWPYVYITTPINNLLANLQHFPILDSRFHCFIGDLSPSFIRNFFVGNCLVENFSLVKAEFNVTTIFAGLFSSFGLLGGLCVIFLFLLFLDYSYLKTTRIPLTSKQKIWMDSGILIATAALLLTNFTNLLFHVVYAYAYFFCFMMSAFHNQNWRKPN